VIPKQEREQLEAIKLNLEKGESQGIAESPQDFEGGQQLEAIKRNLDKGEALDQDEGIFGEQLETIKRNLEKGESQETAESPHDQDFEGGFGGQEYLEDRFATTCGEH